MTKSFVQYSSWTTNEEDNSFKYSPAFYATFTQDYYPVPSLKSFECQSAGDNASMFVQFLNQNFHQEDFGIRTRGKKFL